LFTSDTQHINCDHFVYKFVICLTFRSW